MIAHNDSLIVLRLLNGFFNLLTTIVDKRNCISYYMLWFELITHMIRLSITY